MTPRARTIRSRLAVAALAAAMLASCSGDKKSSSTSPTSLLFQITTSSTLAAAPVVARIASPDKGSVQGRGGRGMVVVLVFTAKDASALLADFRLGGALPSPAPAVRPGHNPAFPGLVVALSTTGLALGGAAANLANLFQIVSPSAQPDGSVQVTAVWTNAQAEFGTDTDATLVAFLVAGTAPDTVPTSPADLNLKSNAAQVTFHVSAADAGATSSSQPSTTQKGSTTTTKPTSTTAPMASSTSTSKAATTTAVPPTTTTTKFLGLF